jgi:hypothetical protein
LPRRGVFRHSQKLGHETPPLVAISKVGQLCDNLRIQTTPPAGGLLDLAESVADHLNLAGHRVDDDNVMEAWEVGVNPNRERAKAAPNESFRLIDVDDPFA